MHITKLGHCCMVLEIDGTKIMTDPGSFTAEAQERVTDVDIILITHEHGDHFHAESVQKILAKNPQAQIVTNGSVGKLLKELGHEHVQVADGDKTEVHGIAIEGHGSDHALVYPPSMGLCENTAYLVADSFYFPGDNFHNPDKAVDILALPVAGPWMKIAEAVDFAREVKARTAFGVHDGMIQPFFRGFVGNLLQQFAPETAYVALQDGESRAF